MGISFSALFPGTLNGRILILIVGVVMKTLDLRSFWYTMGSTDDNRHAGGGVPSICLRQIIVTKPLLIGEGRGES
jgi:hypothetical protein